MGSVPPPPPPPAAAGGPLFELPIAPSGLIRCTTPAPNVYLLTFGSPPDNRLTPAFCQSILLSLDILETHYPPGVLITTSAIPKFYSNGLDFAPMKTPESIATYFADHIYALFRRFLIFPWPTVALLPGHAFAGGLMLATCHDYRFANPHKGYLCLNELEIGLPIRPAMTAIFKEKVSPNTLRSLILEAKRYKPLEALKENIVDGLGGMEEVMAFVGEQKLVTKAGGVYGKLKEEMWAGVAAKLAAGREENGVVERRDEERRGEEEMRLGRVKAWKEGRAFKL